MAIRPWLQSFPLRITTGFDPEYIRCQIDAARCRRHGLPLWSPGNRYDEALPHSRTCTSQNGRESGHSEEEQGGVCKDRMRTGTSRSVSPPAFPDNCLLLVAVQGRRSGSTIQVAVLAKPLQVYPVWALYHPLFWPGPRRTRPDLRGIATVTTW